MVRVPRGRLTVRMRASGATGSTVRVKEPRRGQGCGLLYPVRFAVHEDSEPELKVDERPDDLGRQRTLAQPVRVKDSSIEANAEVRESQMGLAHESIGAKTEE